MTRRLNKSLEEILKDTKPDKDDADKDEDSDNDDDTDGDAYKLFTESRCGNRYDVYLGESFKNSHEYYKLFDMLTKAKPNDEFNIILNNFGGMVHTGAQMVNALRYTKAKVRTIVAGPVYSMASLLAVAVDDVTINDHTFLMFHHYSTWEMGKGSEVVAAVTNFEDYFAEFLIDTCDGFLTKSEMKRICKGEDIYIKAEEARQRIAKRNKRKKK